MVRKRLNDGEKTPSTLYWDPLCGRQQDKSRHGRRCWVEPQWTGVSSVQLGYICWYTRAKSVSFGLYPATRLGNFLFSSWMRGVWGCPGPQKSSASPSETWSPGWASAGAVLGAVGSTGSQRQLFLFSLSPPAKCGVGAETSAAGCSVFSPEDKHDACNIPVVLVTAPGTMGCQACQPTGLPDRAVSSCFMLLSYLSLLFWRSNDRNLNSISVKSWTLKPDVQDDWIALHRLSPGPCFSV